MLSGRHNGERRDTAADLIRITESEFGLRLAHLTPIEGGLDDRARVWQAQSADGRQWAVKSTRRDCRFGLALAAAVADDGAQGVSAPLRSGSGMPWVEVDGVLVSIAPWVEGDDAFTIGADTLSWYDYGRTLRRLHDSTPPRNAKPIRRGIRRWSLPVETLLADVDARAARQSETAAELPAEWTGYRRRLARLARAERRLKETRSPVTRVPVHGDPHLGNVVVDGASTPWLIDFDEATVAPREVDLMLIELGVIFSVPVTDDQRARFRSGYGEADIDRVRIARFGCVRAIEDATGTAHRLLDSPPTESADLEEFLAGQFGEHGLVTLTERELDRLGMPGTTSAPYDQHHAPSTAHSTRSTP